MLKDGVVHADLASSHFINCPREANLERLVRQLKTLGF